jgi:hypothetical protein
MSLNPSFPLTAPKTHSLSYSPSKLTNTITFSGSNTNHHIINALLSDTTPPANSPLNIVLKLRNLDEKSLVVVNINDATVTFNITLTIKNGNSDTIVFQNSVQLNDSVSLNFGLSSPSSPLPLITQSKKSLENALKNIFGLSGDNTASTENPLMTFGQIENSVPEILENYLDIKVPPIGIGENDNKIITKDAITDVLNDFVQPGYKLTKNGNNKLVTTYGNNNLIANFFGTLSGNPGMVASTASGIISNNNLVTVNLVEGSTISLIESVAIPSAIFELRDHLTGAPITFTILTLTSTTILKLVKDLTILDTITGDTKTASVKVTGNLIGSLIGTSTTSKTNYGLTSGSLFTSTYKPRDTVLNDHLTFEYIGSGVTYVDPDDDTTPVKSLPTGVIRLIESSSTRGKNFSFPCNAYGAISSFNFDNTTVPVSTEPPVIINAMLPLFNELAVASGLAYSNQIKNLTDLLSNLKLNIGNLKVLTNYLQAHSENIYVVGDYTSTVTINGNGLPTGYSYYNPTSAPEWWGQELYSPVSNSYSWTAPLINTPNSQPEITGKNSNDGLFFEEDVGVTVKAKLHPMLNTIIIPSTYNGFGSVSYNPSNACGTPFPTYMLSINVNNILTNIVYPNPSLPETLTPYINTSEFSNETQLKNGTQIQICNNSDKYIQFVSRNIDYTNDVTSISQLPNILPVPSFPYTQFTQGMTSINAPIPSAWPPVVTSEEYSYIQNSTATMNAINLRDTTSDVIYIRPQDTIRLIYTSSDEMNINGVWKHI